MNLVKISLLKYLLILLVGFNSSNILAVDKFSVSEDDDEPVEFSFTDVNEGEHEQEWANLYGVKYWYCGLINDNSVNRINSSRLLNKLDYLKDLNNFLSKKYLEKPDLDLNKFKYLLSFQEERLTHEEQKQRNSSEYIFNANSGFSNISFNYQNSSNGLPNQISFNYRNCQQKFLGRTCDVDQWLFTPERKNHETSPTMQLWDLAIKRDINNKLSLKNNLNFKLLCTKYGKKQDFDLLINKIRPSDRK
jgi:hypothetical protein